jgi:hypothetical protein
MKIVALLALLSLTMEILDRSYYDTLGTYTFTQNFQSVRAKNKSEMPSEGCRKSTTLIETQDREKGLKRSTSVEDA